VRLNFRAIKASAINNILKNTAITVSSKIELKLYNYYIFIRNFDNNFYRNGNKIYFFSESKVILFIRFF